MWNIETLNDLIEVLQDLADQETADGKAIGDLPVCIAHQQNWPLAEAVGAVTVADRGGDKVWLAATPTYELDYAPSAAWMGGIEGVDWEAEEE